MCIRLAHLLRILLVSIKPVQASKAAKETIVYVHTYSTCTRRLDHVQRSYYNSIIVIIIILIIQTHH